MDTSVWLDFLIGRNTIFRRELHALIERGVEIVLTGQILQEILQGIRSDLDCKRIEKYLLEFRYLRLSEPDCFQKAANLYRLCRQRGKTVRRSADCLIACQAIEAQTELFHNDRDFNAIAMVAPLKIYRLFS